MMTDSIMMHIISIFLSLYQIDFGIDCWACQRRNYTVATLLVNSNWPSDLYPQQGISSAAAKLSVTLPLTFSDLSDLAETCMCHCFKQCLTTIT
ncbi:hypothetical protein PoB_005032800 [Plakobranchus ocellatus]|uniref:Secreted protein n=1 Tax=Plakobranchus ocellatus TaxID=259542 RepID=A0AAV4BX83_9GAST|nr:hypothetical protein PoB_005032800 [Plakobranchus ocellatus]